MLLYPAKISQLASSLQLELLEKKKKKKIKEREYRESSEEEEAYLGRGLTSAVLLLPLFFSFPFPACFFQKRQRQAASAKALFYKLGIF